jgi:hypothetical protein
MNMFLNIKFIIALVVLGIGFAIYKAFFSKRRPPKTDKPITPKDEIPSDSVDGSGEEGSYTEAQKTIIEGKFVPVIARIYDNNLRVARMGTLDAKAVQQIRKDFHNLGRKWLWNNDWVYAVCLMANGDYCPVSRYMTEYLGNPPEKLHRALQQEETEVYFAARDDRTTLQKYGVYILFAIVALVVLFFWGAALIKG